VQGIVSFGQHLDVCRQHDGHVQLQLPEHAQAVDFLLANWLR